MNTKMKAEREFVILEEFLVLFCFRVKRNNRNSIERNICELVGH